MFSISDQFVSLLYPMCSACISVCFSILILSISLFAFVMPCSVFTIYSPTSTITLAMSLWPVRAVLLCLELQFTVLMSNVEVRDEDRTCGRQMLLLLSLSLGTHPR
ncbi:hypothetical protein KC19_VG024700 [Ceratodon purpureus]|uniref:Uncharacterized protein n=1 Tax=Ceratodon purpureus TaxID=3225 RepID=A0A8T0HLA6_CERPU|nr:hypothetical protein KC19_VG024700 [Ceratodon purpureus]